MYSKAPAATIKYSNYYCIAYRQVCPHLYLKGVVYRITVSNDRFRQTSDYSRYFVIALKISCVIRIRHAYWCLVTFILTRVLSHIAYIETLRNKVRDWIFVASYRSMYKFLTWYKIQSNKYSIYTVSCIRIFWSYHFNFPWYLEVCNMTISTCYLNKRYKIRIRGASMLSVSVSCIFFFDVIVKYRFQLDHDRSYIDRTIYLRQTECIWFK